MNFHFKLRQQVFFCSADLTCMMHAGLNIRHAGNKCCPTSPCHMTLGSKAAAAIKVRQSQFLFSGCTKAELPFCLILIRHCYQLTVSYQKVLPSFYGRQNVSHLTAVILCPVPKVTCGKSAKFIRSHLEVICM